MGGVDARSWQGLARSVQNGHAMRSAGSWILMDPNYPPVREGQVVCGRRGVGPTRLATLDAAARIQRRAIAAAVKADRL